MPIRTFPATALPPLLGFDEERQGFGGRRAIICVRL
jgi:hypothetical protein